MNISENKRVLALSAVFVIAFGATVYYGYGRTQDFKAAQNRLTEISERFDGYSTDKFPPKKEVLNSLLGAYEKVNKVNKDMQADMEKYANVCYGDGKVMSPVDFQNEVRAAISRVAALANNSGSKIGNPAADLGMAQFKNSVATAGDVPFRSFQLKAVERVVTDVLSAGAPQLEKVYCAPLPTELIEARKPAATLPLNFEVAFSVSRGQLPQILNKIYGDKEYFLTITGIAIANNSTLPSLDDYKPEAAAAAAAPAGDDLTEESSEEEEAAAPAPAATTLATRKTGDPAETVRVHLNMQVRYFNPAKGK